MKYFVKYSLMYRSCIKGFKAARAIIMMHKYLKETK